MSSWHNWADLTSVTPTEVRTPRDTDDVVAAVGRALDRRTTVKMPGTGHSFTGIAAPEGIMLSPTQLSGIVSVDRGAMTVTALAGTPLRLLNASLEALDLSLHNMGDIAQQTVAGATSTGTHGTGGLVATLELPERYAADLDTYLLHPALLDVVGGASRVHAAEGYYLPFWYGGLRFVRGLTRRMSCHIRIKEGGDSSGETLTCDADVYDDEGRLLVQLRDFIMKRIHDPEAMRDEIERGAAAPPPAAPEPSAAGSGAVASATPTTLHALAAGMTEREGTELFGRLLAAYRLPPQLVVSTQDLAAAQRVAAAIDPARFAAELAESSAPVSTHPRRPHVQTSSPGASGKCPSSPETPCAPDTTSPLM